MKFPALNVDFSSPEPLGSKRPAQAGIEEGCVPLPLKSGYFIAIISCSVKKRLQIETDMLLIITVNSDNFLLVSTSITLNDLKLKIKVFSNCLQILTATHILKVNCAEMAGDGPGQPA